MLQGLNRLLADDHDLQEYESALPKVRDAWRDRSDDAMADWGGALAMDADGAVLDLRIMGAGLDLL
jgi:hypothetical protein